MQSDVVSLAVPSVLVVEDDSISRALMCTMITKAFPQIRVHSAENGKAGLALFKKHHPQVVLTNLKMPEMDGVTMVKEIGCAGTDVKVIVMTGYSKEMKVLEDLEVEYHIKPVSFKSIMGAIKEVTDFAVVSRL